MGDVRRDVVKECPHCGYVVGTVLIEHARADFECAGCGIRHWSDYRPRDWVVLDKEDKDEETLNG